MRILVTAAAAATLIAVTAFAQNYGGTTQPATPNANATTTNTAPAANSTAPAQNNAGATTTNRNGPSNPAVKTTEGNNPGAPVAGANSFTEGQAKSRIEARGYANVTGLTKDNQGFWRGKAMKDGKAVNVTLDYQGNVIVE